MSSGSKRRRPGGDKPCFVISPIGGDKNPDVRDHANKVYAQIVLPALQEAGFLAKRIDHEWVAGPLTDSIIDRLVSTSLCVGILTGLNANVMYEIGIRHAWALPIICLAEKGTVLPFDLHDHATIFYSTESSDTIEVARKQLSDKAKAVAKSGPRKAGVVGQVLAKAMERCSNRYALDILFVGKRAALESLIAWMRDIRRDMNRDLNGVNEELAKGYAGQIGTRFDNLGMSVSTFRSTLTACEQKPEKTPGCVSLLDRMDELQERGVRIVHALHGSKGAAKDFKRAMDEILKVITDAEALLKKSSV